MADNNENTNPTLNMAEQINAAVTKAVEDLGLGTLLGSTEQEHRGPPPHSHEGPGGEHHDHPWARGPLGFRARGPPGYHGPEGDHRPPPPWAPFGFGGPPRHHGPGGHHGPPPHWGQFGMAGHHGDHGHGHGGPRGGERHRRGERHHGGPRSRSASPSGDNTDGDREGEWEDIGRPRRGSHGGSDGKRSRRGSHGGSDGKRSRRGSHARLGGKRSRRGSHGKCEGRRARRGSHGKFGGGHGGWPQGPPPEYDFRGLFGPPRHDDHGHRRGGCPRREGCCERKGERRHRSRSPPPPFGCGGPRGERSERSDGHARPPPPFDMRDIMGALKGLSGFIPPFAAFQASGENLGKAADDEESFQPAMQIYSYEHAYTIMFSLLGVKKEDIHLDWNEKQGTFHVGGVVFMEQDEEKLKHLVKAESHFSRTVSLPTAGEERVEIDWKNGHAEFKDFKLTVTVPKVEKDNAEVQSTEGVWDIN